MAFLAGLAAGIIAGVSLAHTLLLSLSAALISGAAQSINDYFDFPVDMKKTKKKPLVHGKIPRKHALYLSVLLYAMGTLLGFSVSLVHGLIALLFSGITAFYSARLGRYKYVGNVVVAFSVAFVFVYLGLAGNVQRTFFPFFLAFLANWGREIVKDIEDLKADIGHKISLPMLAGVEMSGYLAAYLILLAVFFSPFPGPLALGIFNWNYYYVVALADVLFIVSAFYIIRGRYPQAEQVCKLAMLLALIAFVAGVVPLSSG